MTDLGKFGKIAKDLSHNPLGIIALAFVFVYSISGWLVIHETLSSPERLILVWFVVIFPILVLIMFYLLVSKHHEKLYAPSDFSDQSHFVKITQKLNNLENITSTIQEEINNQPLYRYTKLVESGKILVLQIFKSEPINLNNYAEQRGFDIKEVIQQAKILESYGWISLENEISSITQDGLDSIATFQDICYGRLK
jgi:hypothetical protein